MLPGAQAGFSAGFPLPRHAIPTFSNPKTPTVQGSTNEALLDQRLRLHRLYRFDSTDAPGDEVLHSSILLWRPFVPLLKVYPHFLRCVVLQTHEERRGERHLSAA